MASQLFEPLRIQFVFDTFANGLESSLHRGLDEAKTFPTAGGISLSVQLQHSLALGCQQEIASRLPRSHLLFETLAFFVFVFPSASFGIIAKTCIMQVLLANLHGLEQTYIFRLDP